MSFRRGLLTPEDLELTTVVDAVAKMKGLIEESPETLDSGLGIERKERAVPSAGCCFQRGDRISTRG